MTYISAADWANYQSIIAGAIGDFGQQPITWKRSKGGLDRDGEDNATEQFDLITLKGLVYYNAMRTWPISEYTQDGMLDKESTVVIFGMDYLKGLGYLNNNGNFAFEQNADRIIINGVVWKCSGNTNLSQAPDKPILCQLVLQKEVIPTQTPAE